MRVAEKQQLVPVALNMHGTRAVQKLIETLSSREQREIVIGALKDGGYIIHPFGHILSVSHLPFGSLPE